MSARGVHPHQHQVVALRQHLRVDLGRRCVDSSSHRPYLRPSAAICIRRSTRAACSTGRPVRRGNVVRLVEHDQRGGPASGAGPEPRSGPGRRPAARRRACEPAEVEHGGPRARSTTSAAERRSPAQTSQSGMPRFSMRWARPRPSGRPGASGQHARPPPLGPVCAIMCRKWLYSPRSRAGPAAAPRPGAAGASSRTAAATARALGASPRRQHPDPDRRSRCASSAARPAGSPSRTKSAFGSSTTIRRSVPSSGSEDHPGP